jgi:apolipoprotein N-acyltransferase
MINSPKMKMVLAIAGILFSGLCWYFSNGLRGDFWYLLWIAPIPVLLISLNTKPRVAFFISFTAYLIGQLSWFGYLIMVATLVPAIIFTIIFPLIFAGIIVLSRRTILKTKAWYAVFAFPVFFTAFEWLLIKFSPDGTAASIAYSQSDFLPLVQLASVSGILGITFMVTLIPSALALCWHFRKERSIWGPTSIVSGILVLVVLLFGVLRIHDTTKAGSVSVGLVALEEESHHMGNKLNFHNELQHVQDYAREITKLASRGVQLVVLPERALNLNEETDSATRAILSKTAKENHIFIVTGYTNLKNTVRNSALVIDDSGKVIDDYHKNHLIKGLESQFTPGHEPGLFNYLQVQAGVAICKDLDFPSTIRQYGASKASFLCVPAWDFRVDDWLHSRMAIIRGVENGFSEVRTARLGRLSISDPYGRVKAEVSCSDGKTTVLIGRVSFQRKDTLYSGYGDWFGIAILIAAVLLIMSMIARHQK